MNITNPAVKGDFPPYYGARLPGALRPRKFSGYGLTTAFAFALTLGTASFAALAQAPAELAQCHELGDSSERLYCYDRVSGRSQPQALPDAGPSAAPEATDSDSQQPSDLAYAADELSILQSAWQLRPDSKRYPISTYHANYILPIRYSSDPNDQPFSPLFDAAEIPDQQLDSAEAKFQISLKARLWTTNDRRWGLWVAYTQQNQWQVYNAAISRPFRETNYMPEVFATYQPNLHFAGFDWKLLNFGLNHQSNGRADPISRSWDRLFVEAGVERNNLALMLRVWTRIEESEDEDDNPDITDYYGHTELRAFYRRRGHSLTLMTRGNLDTGKGAIQAGWFSPPLFGPMRGYVQVFSGYGESMIDYNWNQTTIGIGLAINDGT